MNARIPTSLLVLSSFTFALSNCSSSDGGSNTPAAGNNGVAGSAAAGTPGVAGTPGAAGTATGGGGNALGGGGSAGTAVGGSAGNGVAGSAVAGNGGASAGATSQGGSGGASAGAGGKATGGGSNGGAVGSGGAGSFTLTSEKIVEGMKIATEYTCANGAHPNPPSPPFAWTPGPSATLSYALVMYDPSPKFTHWVVWDIPASALALPAALGSSATLTMPAGAKQAAGSGMGYLGPCPPANMTHTYEFTIYALDVATLPGVTTSTTTANLVTAIQMHDIASALLTAPADRN